MTPTGRLTKGVKTRKYPISKKVIFKRRPRRIDCFVKTKSYKLSKKNENTLQKK